MATYFKAIIQTGIHIITHDYITHNYDAVFHELDVSRTQSGPTVNQCFQKIPWQVFTMDEPSLEKGYSTAVWLQMVWYELATIGVNELKHVAKFEMNLQLNLHSCITTGSESNGPWEVWLPPIPAWEIHWQTRDDNEWNSPLKWWRFGFFFKSLIKITFKVRKVKKKEASLWVTLLIWSSILQQHPIQSADWKQWKNVGHAPGLENHRLHLNPSISIRLCLPSKRLKE